MVATRRHRRADDGVSIDATVLYADLADSTVLVDTYKKKFAAEIRGGNDLVWVGRAANYAAKLCVLGDSHSTWITKAVYDGLSEKSKYSSGTDMWEKRIWNAMNDEVIYRPSYWWSL